MRESALGGTLSTLTSNPKPYGAPIASRAHTHSSQEERKGGRSSRLRTSKPCTLPLSLSLSLTLPLSLSLSPSLPPSLPLSLSVGFQRSYEFLRPSATSV